MWSGAWERVLALAALHLDRTEGTAGSLLLKNEELTIKVSLLDVVYKLLGQ